MRSRRPTREPRAPQRAGARTTVPRGHGRAGDAGGGDGVARASVRGGASRPERCRAGTEPNRGAVALAAAGAGPGAARRAAVARE
eukprot:ctg_410.g216